MAKVELIFIDESGKKTVIKSKGLTKLFNNKNNYGKIYSVGCREPDKNPNSIAIGSYTCQNKETPPPVDTAPKVDAGFDIDAKEAIVVTLDGNASDNPGGSIVEQFWTGPDSIKDLKPVEGDKSKATFTTPTLMEHETLRGLIFTFTATDNTGHTSTDQSIVTVRKDSPPPPPPVDDEAGDAPPGMQKVYDSREHFRGQPRTIFDREGEPTEADSGGIHVNASGKPRVHVIGNGTIILENLEVGFGRFYTRKCNYNASLVRMVRMLDDSVDNDSTKLDARHQYRDEVDANAPDSKTQGGIGNAWKRGEVSGKVEIVHGQTEICDNPKTLNPAIKTGDFYKTRFTVKHDEQKKEIHEVSEIQYPIGTAWRKVWDNTCSQAPDQFYNEAEFMAWSEFWNRLNGKGQIEYAYIKLYR